MTIVIADGQIHALAGGPLSLADMGERTTQRVSSVEFNQTTQRWEVCRNGELLHSNTDYDQAIAWEIEHFNNHLSSLL